jgi:filamentous hemagglutinin family protein
MKNSISPIRLAAVARHAARWQNSCSAWVLAGLGLLGLSLPTAAQAQAAGSVLPARTLPGPRAVVGGRAVITTPAAGARSVLTVDQATQRAIIDWKSFNISRDSEVIFRQPNSTASALNRIYSADPSIIQGKLTANGQVLLINQNGILFDRGAQINTQSLIAATLNLKMSDADFMAGQPLSKGVLTTPAFEGAYDDSGAFMALRADGSLPAKVGIGEHGPADAAAPTINANAGGSIRDYVIQYRSAAAGSRWLTYTDGVTSVNAATVRRLVAGRAYVFRVAAKNLAGTGAFTSPSDVIRA